MRFQIWLSKQVSKISPTFIWILLLVIFIVIIITPLIGLLSPNISKFGVDMFSPVSFRNLAYPSDVNGADDQQSIRLAPAVAYAIGFVLLTIILIPLITNYLRSMGERYLDGTLDKYSWKNHVLFLGFDNMMLCALREECKEAVRYKRKVVVAVPKDVSQVREGLKETLMKEKFSESQLKDKLQWAEFVEKCIEVVQCNKCDKQNLEVKACVKQAYKMFIIGQPDDPMHDANNLRSLDIIMDEICGGEVFSDDFHCYIHIRNIVTFALMQRQGFYEKASRNRVMAFNFYENIAGNVLSDFEHDNLLMLLDEQNEHKNLANCPGTTAHLLILGMTQMGLALAREALMVAHYPNHRLKITLVDDNAHEEMYYFLGRYKELFKWCKYSYEEIDSMNLEDNIPIKVSDDPLLDVEFEFLRGSIAHPKLMDLIEGWAKDSSQILTLAICTNDSAKNMATALYLPRPLLEGVDMINVWVYQQDDDSMQDFSKHPIYNRLHAFSSGEYGSLNTPGYLMKELVKSVDFAYRKSNNPNAQKVEWEQMSQYDRWSTIHNVRSIIAKLRGLGYEMNMKQSGGGFVSCFVVGSADNCDRFPTEEEIKQLSVSEQFRWITDKLTTGIRPTTEEEHLSIISGERDKEELKNSHFANDNIRSFYDLDATTARINIDMTKAIIDVIKEKFSHQS